MLHEDASTTQNPKKWWQWLLLYPTLFVAILGAIPTFIEAYNSIQLGVDYGQSAEAKRQKELWNRNLSCAAAPFDWLVTKANVSVDATICKSGDVFVRVKSPYDQQSYRWVAIDSFFEGDSTVSLSWISKAHAATYIEGAANFATNTIICQKWINNRDLLRRVKVEGQGCFDEVVDTYSGKVKSRTAVACNPKC